MFDELIMQKIAALAPEWNPFPVLQQMDQMNAQGGFGPTASQETNPYNWIQPTQAPVAPPLDPTKAPPGTPLQGVTMPNSMPPVAPPAAATSAPLTPQQLLALQRMMPGADGQRQFQAPAVAPQGGRAIGAPQLLTPQPTAARPSFAALFGRR